MHKYDEFVQKELASHLAADEKMEVTGFLYNKSLILSYFTFGLSMMGGGYDFAVLTHKRMFTIATEMGISSLKMVNKGIREIPYSDIKSITAGGMINQRTLTLELKNGASLSFRLNTLATAFASGQKQFVDSLIEFHKAAEKA